LLVARRRRRQSGTELDPWQVLELSGWPYPRHLAGRLFSAIVHRDTIEAEPLDDLEVVLVNHVLGLSRIQGGG
jgi:hypothetical protein